jgi:hypothetical protein
MAFMTYRGTVQNGVVVLPSGTTIPDGTVVTVVLPSPTSEGDNGKDTRTIWQKLADLGRQVESEPCDLPSDLAANHDHYLHGLPKRQ